MIQEALQLATLGWRLAPVRKRTKRPPMNGWQNAATTDPKTLTSWFKGIYADAGVCLATGPESGVWVLDVDPGEGGLETLQRLVAENGDLPKGPRTDTGTGGFHLFFRQPPELRVVTTKNLSGSGLDVRGDGGQVVLPPTGHAWDQCKQCADPGVECPGLDYRWNRHPLEHDLPTAPDWLLELVTPQRPKTEEPREVSPLPPVASGATEGTNAAEEIRRQHDWHSMLGADGWHLQSTEPSGDTRWTRPGKDGDGISAVLHEPDGPLVNFSTNAAGLCQDWAATDGDGWAYSIFDYLAATRHDGDRSALATEWQEDRQKIQMDQWRAESPDAAIPGPTVEDLVEAASTDLAWAHLVEWGGFWERDHTAREWVLWPLVPQGRAVALYAPAKQGKSTIVLAAVAALATAGNVLGTWRPDGEAADVLYLDFEMTEDDLWERLEGLGYGPEHDFSKLHYALLPSMYPLDTVEGAAQIRALAESVGAKLVIIDTFSRAVQGEENDADTSRNFYRYTGMALKSQGIACLRTDHAGKVAESGQRGSSAKNDDVDVVWSLEKTDQGARLNRTHSRVAWVPTVVEVDQIEQEDGLVDYRISQRRQWPTGTAELASILERLGVDSQSSVRQTAQALKRSGVDYSHDAIRQAQQYRESTSLDAWRSKGEQTEDGLL